mmetsp:Transcript_9178/g.25648  ORF Transcript_9178/g.25648 Transcript_9178/m.25648 type:complete len:203 (-) Transcript_9178:7-615(-)
MHVEHLPDAEVAGLWNVGDEEVTTVEVQPLVLLVEEGIRCNPIAVTFALGFKLFHCLRYFSGPHCLVHEEVSQIVTVEEQHLNLSLLIRVDSVHTKNLCQMEEHCVRSTLHLPLVIKEYGEVHRGVLLQNEVFGLIPCVVGLFHFEIRVCTDHAAGRRTTTNVPSHHLRWETGLQATGSRLLTLAACRSHGVHTFVDLQHIA